MTGKLQRRQFVKLAGAIVTTAPLARSLPVGMSVEKLRTAHVGVGGMGGADLASIASHPQVEVAALCDVDAGRLTGAHQKHPQARFFSDYRQMLSEMGDSIDAVVVSTPDHTHAPAAMSAMNLGKPVYCQKPLTHEVHEARRLNEVAQQKQLATQMGIQVHSAEPYRRAKQMIQDGMIGRVSHVHAWSNKNWGYDGGSFASQVAPPDTLDWNLWVGTASMRPFAPGVYHPGNWRKLIDFGTGTLGDMGVHIFDTPYGALALTAPLTVRTECREPTGVGHPTRNVVEYEFPGTDYTTDRMIWRWYDGADAPPSSDDLALPAEFALPESYQLPGQGSLFVGEQGIMLLPHVGEAVLFPEAKFKDRPRPQMEKVNHYHQWVDACMGQAKTSADFSYAGPLTEALLLGVVANRFPGKRLEWDAEAMQVTRCPGGSVELANQLLKTEYRKGFTVDNL
ncbi:MAG: Gfo/Idh/MocA family oxidoreductase [Mariniblastus sp.]|nr:Gfo/Idh/MocA family oxidoreductase [Mariniblastus sp.]